MVLRSKPKILTPEELWNYALRLVGQRPYSVADLKTKLSRRTDSPAAVEDTLRKLREYGMADDEKFSEAFASSRLQNDGFGRSRVLRDLRAKRVPSRIAEKAVEKTFEPVDERKLARQFLLKKYRGKNLTELLQQQKDFANAYRKLRMAGFGSSVSITLLKSCAKNTEDWMELDTEESED